MAVFRTKKPHEYEMNSTNQKHVYYKSRDITSFSSSKMAGSSCDDDLLRESLSYAANKLGIPNGKFRELQESAIRSVIEAGRDIFVALPTVLERVQYTKQSPCAVIFYATTVSYI